MSSSSPIYFFHGLHSAPKGTKSTRLEESFEEVIAPDFEGVMDIWERFEKAERVTEGKKDLVVVGSSFGGLLAALLYSRHPERIGGYVLMAPALHDEAADEIERMPENAVVIHGTNDEVVPIEASQTMCERHDVALTEVDDGHPLHDSLDLMVDAVARLRDQI